MWSNSQETADLFIFAEEILNGKLHLLCSVTNSIFAPSVIVLSLIYQFLDKPNNEIVIKNLDYNLQHDSHLRTSYQNDYLSKQRNCNISFSLRPQVVLL